MKKRITAFFLALTMIFMLMPASASASALTLDEALQKKNELQAQLAEKNKELASIKDQVEKAAAIRNQYASHLAEIREYIASIVEAMEILDEQIAVQQGELEVKERELDESYKLLGQRLRYSYMNDNATQLSLILGADSFSEALIMGKYMSKMAEHDTELIDVITEIRDEIQDIKDGLEKDRVEQEMLLEDQAAAESEAAKLLMDADASLTYVEALKQATQVDYDALYKEVEAAQAEINNLMSSGWSDEPYVGGNFRWPVPYYTNISSGYGWRTLYGQPNFHTGIDIAGSGINGKGVIASNTGTVYKTVYGYTGYGHYIILDHGGGWMTLYAHLSAIYVSEGQSMNQGDVIGAVGSTGNSTGPHLHFEIRQSGEKLNPIDYVERY